MGIYPAVSQRSALPCLALEPYAVLHVLQKDISHHAGDLFVIYHGVCLEIVLETAEVEVSRTYLAASVIHH